MSRPQLTEVLDSPLAFRDINLSLNPHYLSSDGKTARIMPVVNIDLANVERETRPDGSRAFNLDVAGRVTAPDGSVVYQQGKNYTLSAARSEAAPPREVDSAFSRRIFPAGETLRYQFYVYNPKRDKTLDASSLEVRVTLKL